MSSPPARVTVFKTAKAGSRYEECEDALTVLPRQEPQSDVVEPLVAVVCDGASESMLARDWARLLARSVADEVLRDPSLLADGAGFSQATKPSVDGWGPWLEDYLATREADGNPVQWYHRDGLAKGAFATVLAVAAVPGDECWHWSAAALGDTCLFQVRDDTLIAAFPVSEAAGFGLTPDLLGSRNHDTELIAARAQVARGIWQEGDDVYLVTDAVAAWCLTLREANRMPWPVLESLSADGDAEAFQAWVDSARARDGMRNDDTTLVHLRIGG